MSYLLDTDMCIYWLNGRQSGQPLPDFDLLIASAALVENSVLVTNNTRHYQRIPDLQLENWVSDD